MHPKAYPKGVNRLRLLAAVNFAETFSHCTKCSTPTKMWTYLKMDKRRRQKCNLFSHLSILIISSICDGCCHFVSQLTRLDFSCLTNLSYNWFFLAKELLSLSISSTIHILVVGHDWHSTRAPCLVKLISIEWVYMVFIVVMGCWHYRDPLSVKLKPNWYTLFSEWVIGNLEHPRWVQLKPNNWYELF